MEDKVVEKVQEVAHLGLTHFDMVIIAIIAVSAVIALYRGFTKSFLSIVGWIISAILSIKFYHLFAPLFLNHVDSAQMADIAGFASVFVVSSIVLTIVNAALISVMSDFCGGFLDRSFGLFFGFMRGCILASILFYCMTLMMPSLTQKNETDEEYQEKLPQWIRHSKSLNLLHRGSFLIGRYIPNTLVEDAQASLKEYEDNKKASDSKDRVMKALKTQHRGADLDADQGMEVLLATLPPKILDMLEDNDILLLKDPNIDSDEKVVVLRSIEKMSAEYPQKTYKDSQGKYVSHDALMAMIKQEIAKHSKEVEEHIATKNALESGNNNAPVSDSMVIPEDSVDESIPEDAEEDNAAQLPEGTEQHLG